MTRSSTQVVKRRGQITRIGPMDSHIRHGNAGDDLLRVLQPCRHVLGRISEHAPRGLPVFGVAKPSSPLAGRRSSRRAAALRGGHAPAHPPTPDMIATDCTPSFPVIVTGCLLNPEPARNFHGSLRSLPSSARRAGGCAEMSNASPSKTAVTERASGWSDFGTRSTKSPRCARLCRRPRRGADATDRRRIRRCGSCTPVILPPCPFQSCSAA